MLTITAMGPVPSKYVLLIISECWCLSCFLVVFVLNKARVGTRKESLDYFVEYQPSSGPTALTSHFGLDLIRSISVNHRVAMSTVTCRAWFCKKKNLTPAPPHLFPAHTHKPNPLSIFLFFPLFLDGAPL